MDQAPAHSRGQGSSRHKVLGALSGQRWYQVVTPGVAEQCKFSTRCAVCANQLNCLVSCLANGTSAAHGICGHVNRSSAAVEHLAVITIARRRANADEPVARTGGIGRTSAVHPARSRWHRSLPHRPAIKPWFWKRSQRE
jgi:hypothetical protein